MQPDIDEKGPEAMDEEIAHPKKDDKEEASNKSKEEALTGDENPASTSSKYRMYGGALLLLICIIVLAIVLPIVYTQDDDDSLTDKASNIINNLPVNASNGEIFSTLQQLTNLYVESCPAGVVFAVKTAFFQKIGMYNTFCAVVPESVKNTNLFTPYIKGRPVDYWFDRGYLSNGGSARTPYAPRRP